MKKCYSHNGYCDNINSTKRDSNEVAKGIHKDTVSMLERTRKLKLKQKDRRNLIRKIISN